MASQNYTITTATAIFCKSVNQSIQAGRTAGNRKTDHRRASRPDLNTLKQNIWSADDSYQEVVKQT